MQVAGSDVACGQEPERLLVFVVPQFEEIFAGFGAELPAFTQMVLKLYFTDSIISH